MNWTSEQRETMYRHALAGMSAARIADRLGVPAALVQEHLRRTPLRDQLDVLLSHARGGTASGTAHSLAGLDPKALSIPDLIATAEKSGTGRTKQTVTRLRNQIERLKYQLIDDRDTAADRARLAELRLDLDVARKKARLIEDKIRRLQAKPTVVSGSAVDRRATGGRGTVQGPADPETPGGGE